MKDCSVNNRVNGKKSVLLEDLKKAFNGDVNAAEVARARVEGADFKKRFGDWEGAYLGTSNDNIGSVYSETGEPRLFKKESTNQYYFLDSAGQKDFINKKSFSEFEADQVEDVTKYLMFQYVSRNGKRSLNDFEESKLEKDRIMNSIDDSISSYRKAIKGTQNEKVLSERIDLVEKHKEEFRTELINSISQLGKKFVEVAEEDRGGGVNIKESFETNSKDTATVNTKIFLSTIESRKLDPETMELNPVQGGFLQTRSFEDFNEVWSTLQNLLVDEVGYGHGQNVNDIFDIMRDKLEDMYSTKYWIDDLLDKLDSMSFSKQTEFVQAFNKTRLNYYVTEYDDGNYTVFNATSTNSRQSQITSEWATNFHETFLNKNGTINSNSLESLKDINKNIQSVYSEYNENIARMNNIRDEEVKQDNINQVIETSLVKLFQELSDLGVEGVLAQDINTMIQMNGGERKSLDTVEHLFRGVQFMMDTVLDPKTRFMEKSGGLLNPFDTESSIKALAHSVGVRKTDIADAGILANNGKMYFSFSNPTYLSNKINEWKKDPELLEQMALDNSRANSSWLNYLLANDVEKKNRKHVREQRLDKFQAGLASSFKSKGKNDGVENTKITLGDQINDNITKLLGEKVGGKSYFPTIIAADKSRRVEFEGLKMFHSKIDVFNNNLSIGQETIDLLTGYFEDEYNRMKKVSREIQELPESEKIVHYHSGRKNGLISQIFPEFSHNGTDPRFEELRAYLYEGENPKFDDEFLGFDEKQKELISDAITISLKDRLKETVSELDNISGDPDWAKGSINRDLVLAYGSKEALAGDYLVNGLISSVEYTKLFSGDPAFYKNTADLIKRIPATYSDGLQLRLKDGDSLIFNQATVNGVEVASRYIDKIEKSVQDKSIVDAYRNVNTTDAQAWITPGRWKFLKKALGQWGPQHEVVFEKMSNGKAMSKVESKLAAQPLKGVYFEINDGRPVYLKYSQAVLIPSLVKGTPMQKLLDKMTTYPDGTVREGKDEIHEVITIDGVKVGAVDPTSINNNGTTDLSDNFELNPVKLSNRGWKLQQDLPVKLMHETNVGSQIQKNILEGISIDGVYSFDGLEMSGAQLVQKIHDTVSTLSNMGKEEIKRRFEIDDNNKIKSKEGIYEALIEEFRDREGSDNVISALEKEMPFDAIPQIRGKVESIFMSIMNKAITKISTEGGSFIQVSPFGLEKVGIPSEEQLLDAELEYLVKTFGKEEADLYFQGIEELPKKNRAELKKIQSELKGDSGINIVSENYNGEALLPPRIENGKVLPGQAMIPHSQAMKVLKSAGMDINEMTSDEIKNALDPSALELITYRIPNQGMSSNDYIEIVGILPPGAGDSIIVYDGLPAKTGSDFDIDKLFAMQNSVVFNKETGKVEKLTAENSIYFDGAQSEDQEVLDRTRTTVRKKLAQNELVASYKAVLNNPATYDNMMRSIDGAFLKDDINSLFKAEPMANLQLFSPVQQLKTKFEYISGKFGVGQTANQLVDHVSNQTLDVRLNKYIGIGNSRMENGRKITYFDTATQDENSIATNISAFLNAYVDIAKDPYIARGNHNSITANVTFMLLRAGADLKWVNRFIGQPVLKELVEEMKRSEGITSKRPTIKKKIGKKFVEVAASPIDVVRMRNGFPLINSSGNGDTVSRLSKTKLEKQIRSSERDELVDMDVLSAFEFLQDEAKNFTEGVLAAKSDTSGAGGSNVERLVNSNKIRKVLSDGNLVGYDSKFEGTMLGTYKENSLDWVADVVRNSEMFFSGMEVVEETYNKISKIAAKGEILTNKDFAKSIDNAFYSYMLSSTSLFKNSRSEFGMIMNGVPQELDQRIKENPENFLLQELQTEYRDGFTFLGINNKNKPTYYQNKISRAWLDLYNDPKSKKFAVNLVKYAYTQSGFQNNLNQFFSFIPHEILKDADISREVKAMFSDIEKMFYDDNFVDQFMRHSWDDSKIVTPVNLNFMEGFPDKLGMTNLKSAGFMYKPAHVASQELGMLDNSGKRIFPKFVTGRIDGEKVLFMKRGTRKVVDANGESMDAPFYFRTYKLGLKSGRNRIFEYSKGEEVKKSNIPSNNIGDKTQSVRTTNYIRSKKMEGYLPENTEDLTSLEDDVQTLNYEKNVVSSPEESFDPDAPSTSLSLDAIKKAIKDKEDNGDIKRKDCE